MKQRARKTYSILAVALTAAGCARDAPPEPRPDVVAAREPAPAPAADSEGHGDSVVWAAYRPPSDADGYPLVGNLIRKGGPPERPDAGADGGNSSW
jgi:hypothetical protein